MGRISRVTFLVLVLPFLLSSCGLLAKWFKSKPKPDKDAAGKDLFIGVIESVNPEHHFVLIRTGLQLQLQSGWKLETRPLDRNKSVLSVTPEQKQNFLSADIIDGFPQQGEIVVLPPQLQASADAPQTPATPALQPPPPFPANAPPVMPSAPPPATIAQPPPAVFQAPNGEILPPPIR